MRQFLHRIFKGFLAVLIMLGAFAFAPSGSPFAPMEVEAVTNYDTWNRQRLAREILDRPGITFRNWCSEVPTQCGARSVIENFRSASRGERSATRPRLPDGRNVPDVLLNEDLLRAILVLNDRFGSFQINAVAGQYHRDNRLDDEHYLGRAVDIQLTNGRLGGHTRSQVLDYLEGRGSSIRNFRTQRNSNGNAILPNYDGSGVLGDFLHVEIWGRTPSTAPNINSVSANPRTAAPHTVSQTWFDFRATTSAAVDRVTITFSGGGTFNMTASSNRRTWTFPTRLTVAGTQTVTFRAYIGNTHVATNNSLRVTAYPQGLAGTTFNVTRANTFVGGTPNGNRIATIGASTNFVFTRTAQGEVQAGGWTWVRGHLTGSGAVNPNQAVWISTSQLGRTGSFTTCTITNPSGFANTSVRHSPGGANAGLIPGSRRPGFRPTNDIRRSANGFTWRLGTLVGSNADTANFAGQTVWIATSQFDAGSACR